MIRSVSANVCDTTERLMLTHALPKRLINTRAVAERYGGRYTFKKKYDYSSALDYSVGGCAGYHHRSRAIASSI
jgi:hypothetical protein